MSRFLRDLLDAEEPLFTQALQQLEVRSGKKGVDTKLIGDITEMAHESMRAIGLDPLNSTGPEIYHGLQSKLEKDILSLTAAIGAKDHEDVQHLVPYMVNAANKVPFNRTVFVLKREVAKDMLRKMPPKKLMAHLGYKDIESMFRNEDFDEVYTALRFSEGPDWLNEYNELFESVKADDYELRELRIVAMDHHKYVDLADQFVQKKLHNVTHSKEMGVIVVVPMHAKTMRGIILKTLPLLLHYMNEIKLYSTFFRQRSKSPHFGKVVVQTLIADPGHASQMVGNKVHWRVIQRYLGKHRDTTVDPTEWEPHVQPEDLHWRRAEDLLYHIDPALKFWQNRDYVALYFDGFPVTFNLFDVSFAYSNHEAYEDRYAYHFRESLWDEIFARYMGEKNLEKQVLEQLDNDMIAPEKLPVKKPRATGEWLTEREKEAMKIRATLIDGAQERVSTAVDEFASVFAMLKQFPKTVTIFGTARKLPDNWTTDMAYKIAYELAQDGYAVITGGGKGAMEAANHGAYDAGGNSIGLNILLPHEQNLNEFTTMSFQFKHFFSRKVSMTLYDSAYIYMPGGYGTLDELLEIMVLMQTGKIPKVPIILVGDMFWTPLHDFFKAVLLPNKTINAEDLKLYTIVNEVEEVVEILKKHEPKQEKKL
jgi:uncharacterized protein (TIGR00730 family)